MFYKITFLIMFLSISTKSFASCEPNEVYISSKNICYSFNFTDGPYLNSRGERYFSEGVVTLRDISNQRREINPYFFLWMKMHHNHEHGGRPVVMEEIDENKYLISQILLQKMPGQWFLRLQLQFIDSHSHDKEYDAEIALTDWM